MNTKKLLEERGKEYGEDVLTPFRWIQDTFESYQATTDGKRKASDHCIYQILTKISRLAF